MKLFSAIMRRLPVVAAACLIGGAAFAYPAQSVTDLNIRSGPGTNFRVVGAIPAGGVVDVRRCQGNWCRIVYRGRVGWSSARYLAVGSRVGAPVHRVAPVVPVVPVVPHYYHARPGVSIQLGFGTVYGHTPRHYVPRHRYDRRTWREDRRAWRDRYRHDARRHYHR